MQWSEAPDAAGAARSNRLARRRSIELLAPVVVLGALAVWWLVTGHTWRALLLLALLAVVVQVRTTAPSIERRLAEGLATAGRWIGMALGSLVLGLVFLLITAVGALRPRRRRSTRTPGSWATLGPRGESTSSWQAANPTVARPEPAAAPVRRGSRIIRAVGVVAVAMALDLVAGAVLTGTGWLLPEDRGDLGVSLRQTTRQTMSAPPIVGEPWARQYADDMAEMEIDGTFVPFLFQGFKEYRSENINVTSEERVSHEPAIPPGVTPLRVAFFGGSVMFGIGQRDGHTIPSEFARIAEAAGVPIEVHNYGRPAWVSWQEQIYLERLLARGREFDMVVFLDGYNEFEIQRSDYSTDPNHVASAWVNSLIQDFRSKRQDSPGFTDGLGELTDSYRRNSAVWRVVDSLTGHRDVLVGKPPVEQHTEAEQTDAALDIFERSVERIDSLAADHDVPVRYFWQPRAEGWPTSVIDRLPPEVVPLADVFDGRQSELYIDTVHTNEEGAHLIAQRMWDELGDELTSASLRR